MRLSMLASLVALGAGIAFTPAQALDSPYFPLQDGCRWEYVGDGGDDAVVWVAGVQEVQGVETTVLHWQFSGQLKEYLEQYYTVAEDGTVLVHGFWNREAELMRSFDPPMVLLPSSLGPDAQWCSTVQDFYDLEGTLPAGDPFQICFRVYSADNVHVPAGDFTAFGVGQYLPETMGTRPPGWDAFGRPAAGRGEFATDWYVAGIGEVIFHIYQHFELTSWTQPPTPSRSTTWGAVKREFWPDNALQRSVSEGAARR